MKAPLKTFALLLSSWAVFLSCKRELSCEGCLPGNAPNNKLPIANAGFDQVIALPKDSVLLDGSHSSDADGMIVKYQWTKIAGPSSFTIVQRDSVKTITNTLVQGGYQFELRVTDDKGGVGKDTIMITVDATPTANHPPIANAGVDQSITLPANTLTLDGSRSTDPDNNITAYKWTKISGPSSFSLANAQAVQTQVTNLLQGVYQFELKVTDAGGLFSTDTVQVTVNASTTQAPTGNADIIITLPLDSVYLSVGNYTSQASYQWSQISGPSVVPVINSAFSLSSNPSIALVKKLIPGLYSFKVQASNATGTNADTVNVLVVNDPSDRNTITFLNLKWILADEYGLGILDLSLRLPATPNLFVPTTPGMPWNLKPLELYLQADPSQAMWMRLNASLPGPIYYSYDSTLPNIW